MKKSRVSVSEQKEEKRKPIPWLVDATAPFQEKPHVSTWWITLNSNKSSEIDRGRIEQQLIAVLQGCFEDADNLVRFLKFNHKKLGGTDIELTPELLNDATLFPDVPGKSNSNQRLRYVREVGTKFHRIHLHAEYRIIHYTNLTIDYAALTETANDVLSGIKNKLFSSVYIHAAFVPSSLPLYNYMMKEGLLKRAAAKKFTAQTVAEYEKDTYSDYEEAVRLLRGMTL